MQEIGETAAGGKMAFEVASVKLSKPDKFFPPSFPLDSGDSFINVRTKEAPNGRFFGHLSAFNLHQLCL